MHRAEERRIGSEGGGFDPAIASHRHVADLLAQADIRINGDRPWDIRLHRPGVIEDALARGNLGLGERYMAGDWDAPQLDEFFHRLLGARIPDSVNPLRLTLYSLRARLFNRQTARRAWQVGQAHYDIGNDFYRAMLDRRLTYSCGYWRNARSLDDAQTAKLDLICRKLGLASGMRILDVGCGWGSFMAYAARHYGVECVGLTVSREQAEHVRHLAAAGLPLSARLQDYREIDERFDRIISVGMFEHVGRHNARQFFEVMRRCLDADGLFLLHTIGRTDQLLPPDPWIDRYIFPNGELPTLADIAEASEGLFVTEDVHNFGADYDPTLMAWYRNFEAAWPRFAPHYGKRFYRMWRYYLLSCAGTFRARRTQLWQWVFSRHGVPGGYHRPADPD